MYNVPYKLRLIEWKILCSNGYRSLERFEQKMEENSHVVIVPIKKYPNSMVVGFQGLSIK